ncbi:MAG: tRNA 2-thiouridine(34) synthase MnmA [Bacteroidetes bacterium]|nr:tRNA 2-thiouridine(34) synthase MnmA [Bacteroidota bacterium]
MSRHGTVVVGMSGGVDSSVAAVMLKEQGYDVIGITMKTWDYQISGGNTNKETGCCSLESINDARSIAVKHGFPHYIIDFRDDFGDEVISNFVGEYMTGRTPNPCVLCNTKVKWSSMLKKGLALGADYIATGHYAKVRFDEIRQRHILSKGNDPKKDQTYVLWGISQAALSRTLFPLSELTKPEVRELARQFGLRTAEKSESYEICFIPDNDYNRFLKDYIPGLESKVKGGKIMTEDGEIIGEHDGYPFYTVGQRRGLNIAVGKPVYVTRIIPEENVVVVGDDTGLLTTRLLAGQVNLIAWPEIPESGLRVEAKIRYKDSADPAWIRNGENGLTEIIFEQPKRAVTPGQSVVFYDGNDLVGGGIIERAFIS